MSRPAPASSPARTAYLVVYNVASAAAWSVVLGRTVGAWAQYGPGGVYAAVGAWTQWTQTAAALEVLHALLGVVRAPVATTLMQVASRFLLVWGVVAAFPALALAPPYASMLAAWSVAEVVRYSYFALALAARPPPALAWLRYNAFFLLYPVGILSECALVYAAAAGPAPAAAAWALYAVLAVYVPGSYVLFTHMMAQRQRVMGASKKQQGAKAE